MVGVDEAGASAFGLFTGAPYGAPGCFLACRLAGREPRDEEREREEPGLGASFLQSCEWRIKLREPGMDRCPAEMQSFPALESQSLPNPASCCQSGMREAPGFVALVKPTDRPPLETTGSPQPRNSLIHMAAQAICFLYY
ncbi:hypothetical protein G5714_005513 [Onychostoma macrolepis]|uniref:Uncharacterized protein n=1 Tax=Onychostoma macrolepis TaxID=369639 RepID=A0A7J6D180_9TELE|nr:hypothetical protein G5714_005513 [Onychostoma macrolepis]